MTKTSGISENSLKNLKPFVPGVSGNPAGKPKGKNRSTKIREIAEAVVKAKGLDGTESEMEAEYAVVASLFREAIGGDIQAIKEIQDTLYGKLADKTELTGAEGGPVQISASDQEVLALYRQKIIDEYVKTKE